MNKPTYPIPELILQSSTNSPLKNAEVSATNALQGGADDSNRYTCLQCNETFYATRNAKYCNSACRQKAYRKRGANITIRSCPECHQTFTPGHASQVYCSTACNNANYRQRRAGIVPVFAQIAQIDEFTADDILERTGIKPLRRVVEAAGYRWTMTGWEIA